MFSSWTILAWLSPPIKMIPSREKDSSEKTQCYILICNSLVLVICKQAPPLESLFTKNSSMSKLLRGDEKCNRIHPTSAGLIPSSFKSLIITLWLVRSQHPTSGSLKTSPSFFIFSFSIVTWETCKDKSEWTGRMSRFWIKVRLLKMTVELNAWVEMKFKA